MAYEYCLEDRIETPHSYMYTKYEGRSFLDEYSRGRADCMDRLAEAYEPDNGCAVLKDLDACLAGITKDAESRSGNGGSWFDKGLTDEPTATTEILKDALHLIRHGGKEDLKRVYALLGALTSKFEVFKRIFSCYDVSVKKVGDEYKDISCYILFALCLGAYCRREENLKFLNTALKVNDLVCSVIDRVRVRSDIVSAYASLAIEKKLIEGLLSRKGLL